MSDFASTVVLALSDGNRTTTAHVGDGAILARAAQIDQTAPSQWHHLSWPEHGEYVSTTFFVTDADLQLRTASHAMAIDRLVVTTDGLERLALDFARGVPHQPFLEGICAPLSSLKRTGRDRLLSQSLSRYLNSKAVNDRTDDDKTLILAALS